MSLPGFLRRHRIAVASTAVVAVAAGALVAYALTSQGYPVRHVELNDGGIWVTSDKDGLFGRLNKPAQLLDAGITPPDTKPGTAGASLDVVQDGAAVGAWDRSAGVLYPVDVDTAEAVPDGKVPVGAGSVVVMAGGTVAVLDATSGKVWATHEDPSSSLADLTALDASSRPVGDAGAPSTKDGRAAMTVGVDGTVHVVSTTGDVYDIAPTATGFADPVRSSTGLRGSRLAITAVGGQVVVLDPDTGKLALPGGVQASVPADPLAKLQTPSPGRTSVVVATSTRLVSVPLAGGAPTTLFDVPSAGSAVAAPTWLANCVHVAWAADPGVYARSCDGRPAEPFSLGDGALVAPVFRVNRNAIALNDTSTGKVWDVDDTPVQVAHWEAVNPPPVDNDKDKDKNDQTTTKANDQPPNAQDDKVGARPGRTTVLHVLDNDSDPQGYILSVKSHTDPDVPGVELSIAPDGQTLEIQMPADAGSVHFRYTVDDGKSKTDDAEVTVESRPVGENDAPYLRPGFKAPDWTVPAGGRLSIPAVADWRDYDGDPLFVTGVGSAGVGTVSSTPDGRIEVVAPPAAATMAVGYKVSDGVGQTASSLAVTVLDPASTTRVAPVAQADVARGEVDKPIVIRPLDNDLPGADPTNPAAVLALTGTVPSPAGSVVVTEPGAGTVTITGKRAGVFLLTYTAVYGNAPFAKGQIRVDVRAAPATPEQPVAMPDTGVLYGQNPAIIDVLANDFDPAGGILVVQHAEAVGDDDPVQVAILAGRFLRITASSPIAAGSAVLVRYAVTNGVTGPVTGEVALTAQDKPTSDVPVTRDDVAVVRSGDSVAVPVLDNDSTPAGSTLTLLPVVPGLPEGDQAGQLRTTTVDGRTDDIGASYVSGNLVRYVAPSAVSAPTTALVDYVAVNPDGEQATGHIRVTITPAPASVEQDKAPLPEAVDARVVSGGTVHVNVPTTGVDPDGDSVSVTGLTVPAGTVAPRLGRITKISATTIDYQAFPTAGTGGTDSFTYRVTDRYGKTGDAVVRVAVVQPGDPQPPVAVDDLVTAAPGSALTVDVLANDLRSPDDSLSIADLADSNPDLAGGAKLSSPQGPLTVTSPAADGKPLIVLYSISDGVGAPSVGKLTVRSVAEYNNPPIAVDAYATAPDGGATRVTVDVLARDDDVDGDLSKLTITTFGGTGVSVVDGKVQVEVTDAPQTVPYQIEDGDGAVAAAVIHVPAAGSGAPYTKAGAFISIDPGATKTVDINDYVVDPAGKTLSLTVVGNQWAAPVAGLGVAVADGKLALTGLGTYIGPAAVTFEVTDRPLTDPDAVTGIVTVPVQVGPETPVLRCPTSTLDVVEGGEDLGLDITSLCHVWVADPTTLGRLAYSMTWKTDPQNVDILGSGTHRPGLHAGGDAKAGSAGTLAVTVDGTSAVAGALSVGVVAAPRPTIAPITVDGFKASDTATFDLTGYVTSPLSDKKITVVSIRRTDGEAATTSRSGSTVSIKPGADSHGAIGFSVVVSDVSDTARTERQVTGRIVLDVLNVPDTPAAPVPNRSVVSHVVQLSWATPAANGAPIEYYTVAWGGGSQKCAASPCAITDLTNGKQYRFTLTAHNLVGDSRSSPSSAVAQPNKVPEAVTGLKVSDPQDGSISLSWTASGVDGSPVSKYLVAWDGGGSTTVAGSATSATPTGLVNDNTYTFSVTPVNELGPGPGASIAGQSAGAPPTPTGLTADSKTLATDKSKRAVSLSWDATDPNGIAPTTYTVRRTGGGADRVVCENRQELSCADADLDNDGATYAYSVQASNAAAATAPANHSSPVSGPVSVEAAAPPDGITAMSVVPTGRDGQATLTFDVGASHGPSSTVNCSVNGTTCGQWTVDRDGQQSVTKTLEGLPDGSSSNVVLDQSNGSSGNAGTGANTSPDVSSAVTTFGGYSGVDVVNVSIVGPSVSYQVQVVPNGRAVNLRVQGNGRDTTVTSSAGPELWTSEVFTDTVGFGADDDVSVTASDTAGPAQRPQTSTGNRHYSTRPAPRLEVSEGGRNTTDQKRADGSVYCPANNCRQVLIKLFNFEPNSTVTVYYNTDCAGINPTDCRGNGSGTNHYTAVAYPVNGDGYADIGGRYFGYWGSNVWVDADAYGQNWQSNHVTFTS